MISLVLVIIAAICNAVMDILDHKYAWSIFNKYDTIFNSGYWDPSYSWRNKYIEKNPQAGRRRILGIKIHPMFTDSWHLFKSIMVVSLCFAIAFGFSLPPICVFNTEMLNMILWVAILDTAWNLTFSLFYNRILRA